MYDPPESKAWKKIVAQVAALNRAKPMDGPLLMTLRFYMPATIASRKNGITLHTKRPDLDNLCKAIKDALNEICYKDDAQVCSLIASKYYANKVETGVYITIEEII